MEYIKLADLNVAYEFSLRETADFFKDYLNNNPIADIKLELSRDEIQSLEYKKTRAKYYEYYYILNRLSNLILPFDRVFYHGVAFLLKGDAYLITASSGIGKTTQYRNMKQLHPEDIYILNGDKPILNFTDQEIQIYSSPWKGKERMGMIGKAELKGIIVLTQNEFNTMRKLNPEEAIIPIMQHYLYNPDTLDDIQYVCKMTDRILRNTPVWFYENTGRLDSSELLYQTLLEHAGGKNE